VKTRLSLLNRPLPHGGGGEYGKQQYPIKNYFLGGLGSYTPSKIHGLDNTFQLGVTRTPTSAKNVPETKNAEHAAAVDNDTDVIAAPSESLWPTKDAVSWSGTSSAFSDMLF
jgi:hypothetical protein